MTDKFYMQNIPLSLGERGGGEGALVSYLSSLQSFNKSQTGAVYGIANGWSRTVQGLEMDMNEPLRVDVVFDFVCPWCYIGKRRLEAALEDWAAEHPGDPRPAVRWLPFQLNPDVPAGGISRREHMERKHGPAGPSPEKQEEVAALGRRLGLALEFDRITVQPNTLDSHRLSRWPVLAGSGG